MPTPTPTISPFVIAGERAAAAMRERDEADRAAAQAAFTFEVIGPVPTSGPLGPLGGVRS